MTVQNATTQQQLPIKGEESIMSPKKHGTSNVPVQEALRWGCNRETAERICNRNILLLTTGPVAIDRIQRHYAEHSGYFEATSFLADVVDELEKSEAKEITFYDSNTGKPLFHAPRGRTWEEFVRESKNHGWPSFRDEETVWENVRCLGNGEAVSLDGTHLGHNLPDGKGNRYCINLVSVAGRPEATSDQ